MKTLLFIAGVVALFALPFVVTSSYYLPLITTIVIYSILVLGLDIVFGYTGEVSIGHAALFGVGAYTAGLLSMHFGLGFWWALPAGIVITALFGALLALPALKVTGPYLAMVTLAFGTIVVTLINEMTDLGPWFNHLNLTNGPLGIELRTPLFIDLRDYIDLSLKRLREVEYYYISAIALVLTVVVINRIIASRYGRAFEALRDSPIASDCMGVSVYKHKVLAFVISAGFAGLAGALYAYFRQYIAPEAFNFATSIEFLLAVAMGGRKSRMGPIIGSAIVVFLPNILADLELFRITAGLIALGAVAGRLLSLAQRSEPGAQHRHCGGALRAVLRVLALPRAHRRLQAHHLRADDPVRGLLPARRHHGLRPATAHAPVAAARRPGAGGQGNRRRSAGLGRDRRPARRPEASCSMRGPC
jgi:ABC-type branched-subunit amino acid transport system permease subunit